jgi:hypothetical protein
MKPAARIAFFAAALSVAGAIGGQAFAQIDPQRSNVVHDEASAVAIAEKAALPLIGGEAQLPAARPFKATGHGEIWLVISQEVADPKNPSAPKRAVVIQLDAATGKVLDVDTAN